MSNFLPQALLLASSLLLTYAATAADSAYRSHPPMRRLPVPSQRPMAEGPARYIDPAKGDDRSEGSFERPWKTLGHSLGQLSAGLTLYLRGGTYYEAVQCKLAGEPGRPITVRSYPGELAILDAGYPEFFLRPAESWEPVPGGLEDEYQSTRTYQTGGGFGNFGDSMVPFHRYRNLNDLRSINELFRPSFTNRQDDPFGIYAGPGLRREAETGRIYIRLAHTQLAGLGADGYRGETDPRKLPLVVAGQDHALTLERARHLHVQDVVIRGAQRAAIRIADSEQIELDGLTLYGSLMAMRVSGTTGLRLLNSDLRGHAAPWHSRFHHKDRAGAGYLILAEGNNRDFEIAYCELTDHHDAITMQHVDRFRFHHNLVDNFNDDGLEYGPKQARQRLEIFENVISRCLSTFTLHGKKPEPVESEPGSGVYIYRNIIDLRRGTYRTPPSEPDPTGAFLNSPSTSLAHDHGSPIHPVAYVYHNTFLLPGDAMHGCYAWTWGSHTRGTTRRIFNNIFVQVEGLPGLSFTGASVDDDFQADANLLWGARNGATSTGNFFEKFRQSPLFEASRKRYPPGWGAHDLFADPKFVAFETHGKQPPDPRLSKESPAVDAGVELPAEWPDPLRAQDPGRPDLGALPLGTETFKVGPAPLPR